jgi:molybdate transport system ATP-binding protein
MIEARIRKQFPPARESAAFLLDIQFRCETGITVLFGPSGSGKTLTLDAVAGFYRPDQGRILLDDRILFDSGANVNLPPQARHCGYVFQNYALFPHMTLRKNIEFAAHSIPGLERHRKINEMIDRFQLSDVAGRKPNELSGGQRQRGSIARALIGSPRLLLLDEPARGLDASLREDLYNILRQVREEFRTPTLLVTHDIDECFALGDEMFVFQNGKIVQSGLPGKVLDTPATVDVARMLGLYNILPAEIVALDPGRKTSRIRYEGHELAGPYYPGHLIGDRVFISIRPEQLRCFPRDGKPGANQIPAALTRATEKLDTVRLQFEGGLAAEIPRADFAESKHNKEWVIEFPAERLRVI